MVLSLQVGLIDTEAESPRLSGSIPDNSETPLAEVNSWSKRETTKKTHSHNVGLLCEGLPLDYALQEKEMEVANQYLFALTAHVLYWESKDACMFMAKQLVSPALSPNPHPIQQTGTEYTQNMEKLSTKLPLDINLDKP